MSLDIPKDADIRTLVLEFSSECKYLRHVGLYGPGNAKISHVDMKQDEEDVDSRYFTFKFEAGDKIVGLYGHSATEVFTNGCIHHCGFFVARTVDPAKPQLTTPIPESELVKMRTTMEEDDAHERL